jgi:hypothetical protein
MFEMLVGYPPFCSDDQMTTCRKVIVLCKKFFFSVTLQNKSCSCILNDHDHSLLSSMFFVKENRVEF